ncbi:hypothetical protein SHAM105786_12220 [Shewanella amazonensis]
MLSTSRVRFRTDWQFTYILRNQFLSAMSLHCCEKSRRVRLFIRKNSPGPLLSNRYRFASKLANLLLQA